MSAVIDIQDLWVEARSSGGSFQPIVEGVSVSVYPGEVVALIGESGSGKSVTGFSVIGLVDPPGRVVEGSIDFQGEELVGASDDRMRALRGNKIAMIFQDPMMTLNPVLRIDTQMIEAILAHEKVSKQIAWERARDGLVAVGIPAAEERLMTYLFINISLCIAARFTMK